MKDNHRWIAASREGHTGPEQFHRDICIYIYISLYIGNIEIVFIFCYNKTQIEGTSTCESFLITDVQHYLLYRLQ